MKYDLGYNFIRITFTESELSGSSLTVPEDPAFEKFPVIAYCEDTGALYTGAYDDGTVTLAEYGSGSGGGGGGGGSVVFFPISVDWTGDTPDVTTTGSIPDITAAIKAGKYVILKDVGTAHIIAAYHFSYCAETFMDETPSKMETTFSATSGNEVSASIFNIYVTDDYIDPNNSGFVAEVINLSIAEG